MELFNWEARWESDVVPLLDHPKVQGSLAWFKKKRGKHRNPLFKGMKPFLPYQCGREPQEGWQFYTKTDLDAYRPIGECHWIYVFALAIGKVLYPDLTWRGGGEGCHTVAVGFREGAGGTPQYFETCGHIEVVSDILMADDDTWTAEDSIAYSAFYRYCCRGFSAHHSIERDLILKDSFYDAVVENLTNDFIIRRSSYTPQVMDVINRGKMPYN